MTKTQNRERTRKEYEYRRCPAGADENRHEDRESVRLIVGNTADDLILLCPQSVELKHALNKLAEALHWAHDAIDRHWASSPETKEPARLHDDCAILINFPRA